MLIILFITVNKIRLDEITSDFAYKCANFGKSASNLSSIFTPNICRTKSPKDIKYLSMEGNLLALIGIQSLIDVEYFRDDLKFAIRFGTFARARTQ